MKGTTALLTLAIAPLASSFTATADDAHIESLNQRIASLEQRLAEYEARDDNWLTEKRAAEIRGLVHDVLADADTRASLLDSAITAGWDNGFYIGSTDGNFRLNIAGNVQVRYMYSHQSDPPDILDEMDMFVSHGDRHRGGFENTRTQLIFTGHVVNPNWIYRVQGNFNRDGGTFFLEDAFIGHVFGNGWTFLAGQFRVPMLREFMVVETQQQAVERSLVHQEFGAGRTQGVAVDYRNDFFHFTGGFTDGHPATGGFNTPALAPSTDYSLTGRVELLLAGTWDQFAQFASPPGDPFGFLVGGALHYQRGEYGTTMTELEVLQWTLDGSLAFGGANIFAYVVGRHIDGPGVNLDQYGAVIQGGYFINEKWEIVARYEWGDDDMAGADLSIVTAGFNHYIAGQRLKLSGDVGFALNEVNASWGDGFIGSGGDIAGWRTDRPGDDGQIVVRGQLQLLF